MSVLSLPRSSDVGEVGAIVLDRTGIPKDRWEIAAQLEVLGYRDTDARDRFGFDDVFAMADAIFDLFRRGVLQPKLEAKDDTPRPNRVLFFLRHYLEGFAVSLPMVLQGATMILWGYGLWGAIDLDIRTGTAIALGFIASYVVTSGFSWAITRRGLFYYYQKEGALARWSVLRMWWIAVRFAVVLIIPALIINAIYGVLPGDLFWTALAYYGGLVFLWLNWSMIYLVRRTAWLLAVLALSIAIVAFTAGSLGWPIIAANLAGLAVADVLTFLVGLTALNRWARDGAGKPAMSPPRLAVLVYTTGEVFLYGLLYSAFIFADRLIAWTATRGREDFPPYPFWLNARYELGMDVALIVVVLLAGIVEYMTQRMSYTLVPAQKGTRTSSAGSFVQRFRSADRRDALLITASAVVSVAVAVIVFDALRAFPDDRLQASLRSTTTVFVFWVAAVSYGVFMIGLQSILAMMALSRADLAVRTLGTGLAVNVATGFLVSRSIHYSMAVAGLLAGSIVVAVLARRRLRSLLAELDYHYYAAY